MTNPRLRSKKVHVVGKWKPAGFSHAITVFGDSAGTRYVSLPFVTSHLESRTVDPLECQLLERRFGLAEKAPQGRIQEIAAEFGISPRKVQRELRSALWKVYWRLNGCPVKPATERLRKLRRRQRKSSR